MDFSFARFPCWELNHSKSFKFSPTSGTKLPLKPHYIMDLSTDGNGFYVLNFFNDLKIHGIFHPYYVDLSLVGPVSASPLTRGCGKEKELFDLLGFAPIRNGLQPLVGDVRLEEFDHFRGRMAFVCVSEGWKDTP